MLGDIQFIKKRQSAGSLLPQILTVNLQFLTGTLKSMQTEKYVKLWSLAKRKLPEKQAKADSICAWDNVMKIKSK